MEILRNFMSFLGAYGATPLFENPTPENIFYGSLLVAGFWGAALVTHLLSRYERGRIKKLVSSPPLEDIIVNS